MKHASNSRGFTIVETLIVLAVTGILFVSAALLINGRTDKNEFTQAIHAIQTQIQQTINEVQSGYYPNKNNFKCSATPSGPDISTTSSGNAAEQGTNGGCIFLGKVMQFGTMSGDIEEFKTYTIAGLQNFDTGGGGGGSALANAKPKVVSGSTVTNNLQYGLTTSKMYYDNVTSQGIGAVGFISSLGQYSNGNLLSGSQHVDLVPVLGSGLHTGSSLPGLINSDGNDSGLTGSTPNPDKGVEICFNSGTTNQSGLITIGKGISQGATQDNSALTVNLKIYPAKECSSS